MNKFRKRADVGDLEYLVFLTSRKIPNNHFNGIQFDRRNIFVDIENWERQFLKGSPDRYPIAFHVWISILINHYFPDETTAQDALHWVRARSRAPAWIGRRIERRIFLQRVAAVAQAHQNALVRRMHLDSKHFESRRHGGGRFGFIHFRFRNCSASGPWFATENGLAGSATRF